MAANPKAIAAANAHAANGVSRRAWSSLGGPSAPCRTDAGKVASSGIGMCHEPAVTPQRRTTRSNTVRRHARSTAPRRVLDREP
jgi:hypothetical protein